MGCPFAVIYDSHACLMISVFMGNLHSLNSALKANRRVKMRKTFTAAIILGVISGLAFLLPALTGVITAEREDNVFLGYIRSDDYHRYASFMSQAKEEDRFFFLDRSAVEHQTPRIIALYFFALGRIADWFSVSETILWAAATPLVAVFFFVVLNIFLSYIFEDRLLRILTLAVTAFGTGWERVLYLFGYEVPRLKNTWMDGFSLFSLHHNPLKVLGLAFLLLLGVFYLRYLRKKGIANLAGGFACVLLLWGLHPNTAIAAYGALFSAPFLSLLINRKRGQFMRALKFTAFQTPAILIVLFYIWWMKQDPIVAHIITCYQANAHEALSNLWIRYGFLLPLALLGLPFNGLMKKAGGHYLLMWLATGFIFANLPFLTGLLFQHTLFVPLAVFSASSLYALYRSRKKTAITVTALLFVQFLIADAAMLVQVCRQTKNDVWPTSLYISHAEYECLRFLNVLPSGNVLIDRDLGNKAAWLSGKNVFLGHWGTTPYRRKKEHLFSIFFDPGASPQRRRKILEDYEIRYIVVSTYSSEFQAHLPWERIFQDLPTKILRVCSEEGSSEFVELREVHIRRETTPLKQLTRNYQPTYGCAGKGFYKCRAPAVSLFLNLKNLIADTYRTADFQTESIAWSGFFHLFLIDFHRFDLLRKISRGSLDMNLVPDIQFSIADFDHSDLNLSEIMSNFAYQFFFRHPFPPWRRIR